MRLLGYREYCETEIRYKLQQRNIASDLIDTVISQLQQAGYQSDFRYAESFLRSRMARGEAPWLAAQKASQRGVDADALQIAVANAESTFDSFAHCRTLLQHRDPHALRHHDERVWQRHARFLRNKGYDADTILQTMKEVEESLL
ncbi:MAG: regulatory protein RecX [Mariprofundaceae bacterium]